MLDPALKLLAVRIMPMQPAPRGRRDRSVPAVLRDPPKNADEKLWRNACPSMALGVLGVRSGVPGMASPEFIWTPLPAFTTACLRSS